jgi:alkanesulfonate monooxygenase SsuD/methylene tetrahydromethanopterin reductase-like flavin-dependent oxidoreductase (luciferase family)
VVGDRGAVRGGQPADQLRGHLPDRLVPIYFSGFGPQAVELAARIGDGLCTAMPDADLVGQESVGEQFMCWPDVDQQVSAVRKYLDAGFDEVYVQQIGPEQRKFFDAWAADVLSQPA